MSSVNKAILLGNLGADPEVRHLENGRAVATFSLATNETYKNKAGEKVTSTEWHNIVLWSPLAEISEKYLKKGAQVYIEGNITHRSYTSDGTTKYITEVVGRDLTLLGRKEKVPPPQDPLEVYGETLSPDEFRHGEDAEIDDLPF